MSRFEWRSALLTWLTAILIRCCRETWHDDARILTRPVDIEAHEPEVESASENEVDLERALDAMPPGYREVLVLHDVEGFTHEEIARALNIVPGTSKSQLARARQALRERLASAVISITHQEPGR